MNEANAKVAVLGAGNFGTALAHAVSGGVGEVRVWDHFPEVLRDIDAKRENTRFLPGIPLRPNVKTAASPAECVRGAGVVVLSVPSLYAPALLDSALPHLGRDVVVASAAKGVDAGSQRPVHLALSARLRGIPLVLLAGPALANEFSRGVPTRLMLASESAAAAARVRGLLRGSCLGAEIVADVMGAALGGILKNIYAILLGYADAIAAEARNAQAALLTAALGEMARLAVAMGAVKQTIYGLAGLGDLLATALSEDSHNRSYGRRLAAPATHAGEHLVTPEGARAAEAACAWAAKLGVALPLAGAVARLVRGERPALADLLPLPAVPS
jgi:glycerol-3-phosphate dehydrogenase (NAD(P)+)